MDVTIARAWLDCVSAHCPRATMELLAHRIYRAMQSPENAQHPFLKIICAKTKILAKYGLAVPPPAVFQ